MLTTVDPLQLPTMGMLPDITNEAYHSGPGVSKSGLDRLAQSPAHFLAYLAQPYAETPAQRFGHIAHRFILEGIGFMTMPAGLDKRTKDGKAEHSAIVARAEAEGLAVVSADESDALRAMRDAFLDHPAASALLDDGQAEMSGWWFDQDSGELCRFRPDFLRHDGVILDYKTAEDASPSGFSRSVAKYRYHVQAAFYSDGFRAATGSPCPHFAFIAQEKAPPYAVGVYVLDPEAVELGRMLYRRDLMRLAECKINKSWPGYSNKVETINLPKWAFKEG